MMISLSVKHPQLPLDLELHNKYSSMPMYLVSLVFNYYLLYRRIFLAIYFDENAPAFEYDDCLDPQQNVQINDISFDDHPNKRYFDGSRVDENQSYGGNRMEDSSFTEIFTQNPNEGHQTFDKNRIEENQSYGGSVERSQASKSRYRSKTKSKKPLRRPQPGTAALREIRNLQRTTHNLLKTAPFSRLVKEVIRDVAPNKGYRIKPEAIQALMDVSYFYISMPYL